MTRGARGAFADDVGVSHVSCSHRAAPVCAARPDAHGDNHDTHSSYDRSHAGNVLMQYPTVARLPAECRHNFNPLPRRDRLRVQCAVGGLAAVRTGNAITAPVLPADEYDSALRGRAASAVIARSIVELRVAARCSLGGLVGPSLGGRCSRRDVPIATGGAWRARAGEVKTFCASVATAPIRNAPAGCVVGASGLSDRRVH